jgi:hypothetical protein
LQLTYLTFDGYLLTWHGENGRTYTAFSGPADESMRESLKNFGPTPQGTYSIDPKLIEVFDPSDDWGEHRVMLIPHRPTIERMKKYFEFVRTEMYIHGGTFTGTHGCIEINDDSEELDFFQRLKDFGMMIELEVRYVGERKQRYEDPKCPY